jgi:hypothetical protein
VTAFDDVEGVGSGNPTRVLEMGQRVENGGAKRRDGACDGHGLETRDAYFKTDAARRRVRDKNAGLGVVNDAK